MTPSQRAVAVAIETYAANDPHTILIDGNAMKAALTAYHAALAVDGVVLQAWQPIETAPKDTSVLISDGTLVLEAKFVSAHGFWLDPYGECEDPWIGNAYTPIRWMPLPPPPAASDGEERR